MALSDNEIEDVSFLPSPGENLSTEAVTLITQAILSADNDVHLFSSAYLKFAGMHIYHPSHIFLEDCLCI